MGAVKALEQQIQTYVSLLTDAQKKIVLGVVKNFIHDEKTTVWTKKEYLTEMNRRFDALDKGKINSLSLTELESRARKAYQRKKA
jgi:hypothetical protein